MTTRDQLPNARGQLTTADGTPRRQSRLASVGSRWLALEAWVGSRSSAIVLFLLGLGVFALQSVAIPAAPGRDMVRYVQLYLELGSDHPLLPTQITDRGPLAGLAVGVPLQLGGVATEAWLALLFAASILAWGAISLTFGARAAIVTSVLLLLYPGYGILFHGLSSDAPFAAGFAGWVLLSTRAIRRPSGTAFLVAGLGMGVLVLIRPANVVLLVVALVPLLLRASWNRRLAWMAAFFIGAVVVTQAWKTLAALRYGDEVGIGPSPAVLGVALLLAVFLLPAVWRRRALLVAIPVGVALVIVLAATGRSFRSPAHYADAALQSPESVLLYRAFVMDRIVSPQNGPASQKLGVVVRRDLLTQEPYRSYGIDLDEFFSSGSTRMFFDLEKLGGADLAAVAGEAIRRHPARFGEGIARTFWEIMAIRRVYSVPASAPSTPDDRDPIVVDGRRLPRPSDGEPIPASHFLQRAIMVGQRPVARQVWRSPSDPQLVFRSSQDERRWRSFAGDTGRLAGHIPTRSGETALAHRLNQASHRFPPPIFWLAVGLVGLAIRRPRFALVALVPTAAGLTVVVATALVTESVAHYAVPVAPSFIMLAAAGVFGEGSRGGLWSRRRAT